MIQREKVYRVAYNTIEQALESFRRRYNENEFTCIVNKISSGYVYIVKPKSKVKHNQNNCSQMDNAKKVNLVSLSESLVDTPVYVKKTTPAVSSLATAALSKVKTLPIKKTKNIEDETVSDEAIKAVIACRAKRKKPVPYVREEFTANAALNINQHDSERPRCIYCGDYRSGIVRDHVVSVAWRGGVRHYDRSHTVPACPQCNSLLGDKPIHNIADRAAFLIGAIAHHERRYLCTVDRTQDELAEMDHFLAISVKSAMYEKAVALQRIEYAKQVAAGYYDYATIKHLVKQGREIS